jgi:hypothetical protein
MFNRCAKVEKFMLFFVMKQLMFVKFLTVGNLCGEDSWTSNLLESAD